MKGVKYERHLNQCLEPCVFRTSVDSLLYSIYSIQQRSADLLKKTKHGSEWKRTCRQCRRPGFDPWVEKIPGEGNDNPLQYSCLENSMDRGAPWGHKESDTTMQPTLSNEEGDEFNIYAWNQKRWLAERVSWFIQNGREFSSAASHGRRRDGMGETELSGCLEQTHAPHTQAAGRSLATSQSSLRASVRAPQALLPENWCQGFYLALSSWTPRPGLMLSRAELLGSNTPAGAEGQVIFTCTWTGCPVTLAT